MNNNCFVLARIFHVLAVVLWIGGVGFVTTVLIPSISKTEEPAARLKIFEAIETKFGFQVKLTTLIAGISGVYMLEVTDGWSRYLNYEFWWLHLMTFVWAVFTLVLFILEPLFLQKMVSQTSGNKQRESLSTSTDNARCVTLIEYLSDSWRDWRVTRLHI
ncbi:MAG: hypothetical protein VYC92_05645 [SAR324 cluster bacterium]|nr:hypothetical protein [SAR324 cluster bacterium]